MDQPSAEHHACLPEPQQHLPELAVCQGEAQISRPGQYEPEEALPAALQLPLHPAACTCCPILVPSSQRCSTCTYQATCASACTAKPPRCQAVQWPSAPGRQQLLPAHGAVVQKVPEGHHSALPSPLLQGQPLPCKLTSSQHLAVRLKAAVRLGRHLQHRHLCQRCQRLPPADARMRPASMHA